MSLLSPAEYYAAVRKLCNGKLRYMRRVEGPFEDGLAKGERKRLKRLEREGFRVEQGSLPVCYPIIEENRKRKGRKYGMAYRDWLKIAETPETVYSFVVMPGLLAAAICARVEPRTLYVSAWGDAQGQEKYSPVVLLAKGIYDWCAVNNFTLLDIGIADEPGLIAFKERLGFKPMKIA